MTVVELRDELNKLIQKGLGEHQVQVLNSPDDGLSGEWEESDYVTAHDDGTVMIS
ncbi:MAG: hypothetical protein ABI843_02365 [Dokdonella sp.]